MPKTTFTAIDPAGATHTRTSERREYTHTVVYLPSEESARAWAVDRNNCKTDGTNYDYAIQCAAGTHEHVTRVTPASGYHPSYSAEWIANAQESQRLMNADRIAKAKAQTDGLTRDEYIAKNMAERLARIDAQKAAGYYETFQNAGWCGRLDLAQKLATAQSQHNRLRVTILEATRS